MSGIVGVVSGAFSWCVLSFFCSEQLTGTPSWRIPSTIGTDLGSTLTSSGHFSRGSSSSLRSVVVLCLTYRVCLLCMHLSIDFCVFSLCPHQAKKIGARWRPKRRSLPPARRPPAAATRVAAPTCGRPKRVAVGAASSPTRAPRHGPTARTREHPVADRRVRAARRQARRRGGRRRRHRPLPTQAAAVAAARRAPFWGRTRRCRWRGRRPSCLTSLPPPRTQRPLAARPRPLAPRLARRGLGRRTRPRAPHHPAPEASITRPLRQRRPAPTPRPPLLRTRRVQTQRRWQRRRRCRQLRRLARWRMRRPTRRRGGRRRRPPRDRPTPTWRRRPRRLPQSRQRPRRRSRHRSLRRWLRRRRRRRRQRRSPTAPQSRSSRRSRPNRPTPRRRQSLPLRRPAPSRPRRRRRRRRPLPRHPRLPPLRLWRPRPSLRPPAS